MVATKKTEEVKNDKPVLFSIEELAQNLRPSVFAGMKKALGWAEGLKMTEEDFNKAKEKWLKQSVKI